MATMTTAHISIVVYEGDPIDSQGFRHTALFVQFTDRSPTMLAHVAGPSGGFEFQVRINHDPSQTQTFAKFVDVGFLGVPTNSVQLTTALRAVEIKNNDREFNCQTWVEQVLKKLKDRKDLSQEEYDKGVDGMVDAIAEAKDDQD